MLLFGKIEISHNFEYLLTLPGFLKILEVIFGVIALSLGVQGNDPSASSVPPWKEEFFQSCLIVIVVLTFIYLLLHCVSDDLVTSGTNKLIDVILHVMGGIHLFVAGSLIIRSAAEIQQHQDYAVKISGGVFAIIDGLLYLGTGVAVFMVKSL